MKTKTNTQSRYKSLVFLFSVSISFNPYHLFSIKSSIGFVKMKIEWINWNPYRWWQKFNLSLTTTANTNMWIFSIFIIRHISIHISGECVSFNFTEENELFFDTLLSLRIFGTSHVTQTENVSVLFFSHRKNVVFVFSIFCDKQNVKQKCAHASEWKMQFNVFCRLWPAPQKPQTQLLIWSCCGWPLSTW